MTSLFKFSGQSFVKRSNQLNGAQPDVFLVCMECLPRFQCLKRIEHGLIRQILDGIARLAETLSARFNHVDLPTLVLFDHLKVSHEFINTFWGSEQPVKRGQSSMARNIQTPETSKDRLPHVPFAGLNPRRLRSTHLRFP